MSKFQLKGKGSQTSTTNPAPGKFSFSLKPKNKPKPKPTEIIKKSAFGEESSKREREEENEIEYVTGLEENEITSLNPKNTGPLVIPSLKNDDFRRSRKKAHYVPEKEPTNTDAVEATILNNKPLTYGLQIQTKTVKEDTKTESTTNAADQSTSKEVVETKSTTTEETVTITVNSEEDLTNQAIKELTKGASSEDEASSLQKKVLPAVGSNEILTEGELFKQDVESRPRECTLEEYEEVPVEEFGAALLRGMGWKDGQGIGKSRKNGLLKPVDFAARPNLLGLGARPKPPGLDDPKKSRRRP